MKQDEELSDKYSALIKYFEKNFYKNSPGRKEMEKFVTASTSQLDILFISEKSIRLFVSGL